MQCRKTPSPSLASNSLPRSEQDQRQTDQHQLRKANLASLKRNLLSGPGSEISKRLSKKLRNRWTSRPICLNHPLPITPLAANWPATDASSPTTPSRPPGRACFQAGLIQLPSRPLTAVNTTTNTITINRKAVNNSVPPIWHLCGAKNRIWTWWWCRIRLWGLATGSSFQCRRTAEEPASIEYYYLLDF